MGGAQSSSGQTPAGQWSISLGFAGAYSHAEHDVSPEQYEPDIEDAEQAQRHILDFNMFIVQLSGVYGLTDWLSVGLEVPVRTTMVSADFLDLGGDDLAGFQSIHHRDETLVGLADPVLTTRWALPASRLSDALSASVTLGATAPLGQTEQDPFALGKLGKRHQHVFYGSGTVDVLMGLNMNLDLGGWSLHGVVRARGSLYENEHGYKGPMMVEAGLGARSSLGLQGWSFQVRPEIFHENPATWTDRPAENSGRTELLASAGVAYGFASGVGLQFTAKVPVLTRSLGGQLEIPFLGSFGVSYSPPMAPTEAPDSHAHAGVPAP